MLWGPGGGVWRAMGGGGLRGPQGEGWRGMGVCGGEGVGGWSLSLAAADQEAAMPSVLSRLVCQWAEFNYLVAVLNRAMGGAAIAATARAAVIEAVVVNCVPHNNY